MSLVFVVEIRSAGYGGDDGMPEENFSADHPARRSWRGERYVVTTWRRVRLAHCAALECVAQEECASVADAGALAREYRRRERVTFARR